MDPHDGAPTDEALALWHDHLRAATRLVESASTPAAAVDALVRAGWKPDLRPDGTLTDVDY